MGLIRTQRCVVINSEGGRVLPVDSDIVQGCNVTNYE